MKPAIGVFDSGVGGLSVLRALRAELPAEDFVYVADNAHAPYGERTAAHVIARSQALAGWLAGREIKALVIACNTATAAAIHLLRASHAVLPMVGVEPALKPAVPLSRTGRIGVMATAGTLASAKFQALLQAQAGLAEFVLQPCDGLADAIERAAASGDETATRAACERHLAAMGAFGDAAGQIDTLVLGCTHYVFAARHLQAIAGERVRLVDNGAAIARQTGRLLQAAPAGGQPGRIELFSTGDPASLQAGARAWLALDAPVGRLAV